MTIIVPLVVVIDGKRSSAYQLYKCGLRLCYIVDTTGVCLSSIFHVKMHLTYVLYDNFSGLKPYFLFTLYSGPNCVYTKTVYEINGEKWKIKQIIIIKWTSNLNFIPSFCTVPPMNRAFNYIGTRWYPYLCAISFVFYLFNLKYCTLAINIYYTNEH